MELTQEDYEERKSRVETGMGDDDDARLVKLYEREGFTWDGRAMETSSGSTPSKPKRNTSASRSSARTTPRRSNKSVADATTVLSTDGPGQTSASSGDSE